MDAKGVLNGKFTYKVLGDGGIDRTKVICVYCKAEFAYYRSTSSLKYHLSAKHAADTESRAPAPTSQTETARQTHDSQTLGCDCRMGGYILQAYQRCGGRWSAKNNTNRIAARNPGRYAKRSWINYAHWRKCWNLASELLIM